MARDARDERASRRGDNGHVHQRRGRRLGEGGLALRVMTAAAELVAVLAVFAAAASRVAAARGPGSLRRRRGVRGVVVAALLAAAVITASVSPASAMGSSDSADAPLLVFQSGDAPAVGLSCDGYIVFEGDTFFCLLEGYSGAAPSASFSVSSPDATAARPAISPIISRPVFVDEGVPGFGGSGWYVGFNSLNDDQCNAPTTVVLSVVADGVTYSASIEVLSDEPTVLIDGWWVSCYPAMTPSLSVADATASEADGDVTFVVNVSPPIGRAERSEGPALAHEVSVDYSTAPDSASDGSDFRGVSGTLTIPAGTGRATISVPLVDDSAAERRERFRLTLSNAVGVEIAFYHADATIVDDDTLVADPVAPAAVCEEASLRASVGDVFDVGQSGFDRWNHVFVDLELSCGDALGRGMRHPTSVSVINGPNASRRSRQCLTRYDSYSLYETEAVSVANSCQTSADYSLDAAGATHVLRIPDTAIGEDHQMSAWVDADRDGELDAGEPYVIFGSDFASADLTEEGFYDYEFPEDFTVEIGPGSTRVGRGGHYSILVLRFTNPAGRTEVSHVGLPVAVDAALANLPAGVEISAGPSRGQEIICVNASGSGNAPASVGPCRTSDTGHLAVFYRVPLDGVDAHMQHDVLRIHYDRDRDGHFDHALSPYDTSVDTEPSRRLYLPVAKAANYIALGDSYSSGENGDTPESGAYQSGIGDADGECHRWDQAYPYIFNRDFLKNPELAIDATFKTLACTGAITHNIHNPADPNGNSLNQVHVDTNRPSHEAPEIRPIENLETGQIELLPTRGWEPRQAVSLASAQQMRDVDMITLTIGGNDLGFANALTACVSPVELDRSCGRDDIDLGYDELEQRIAAVIERLRAVAPGASIFVLGYPYLTPVVGLCDEPSDACESLHDTYRLAIDNCHSMSATEVLDASFGGFGFGRGRIDYDEAQFLWLSADRANAGIKRAAELSGAHFVSVAIAARVSGRVLPIHGRESFVGHSACDVRDPWMHGFVVDPAEQPIARSGRSFHPTKAGQRGYADILEHYILDALEDGAEFNEAGLPVNPAGTIAGTSDSSRSASSDSHSLARGERDSDDAPAQSPTQGSGTGDESEGEASDGSDSSFSHLVQQRVTAVGSECGAVFVSPGAQLRLSAVGFAPNATVSFEVRAATLGEMELGTYALSDTTADAEGLIEVQWSIPDAPEPEADGAPRAYLVEASGTGAGGETHIAYMIDPLVAYPDTAPCAVSDTAETSLGRSVQIPVLANDVAPSGGSLDPSSLWVQPASGGAFAVDHATGSVTFTPDPGFSGMVSAHYWVYDSFGVGVRGDIEITVDAGCTITGVAGAVRIVGTEGDDVICVPDPDDRRALHVIDAKGGNDIILGGAGVDLIYTGAGADIVYAGAGSDHIDAGAGTDVVYGGSGFDTVYSTDLADTVHDDPGGSELVVVPAVMVEHTGPVTSDAWHYVDVSETVTIDVLANDYDINEDLDAATLRITRQPTAGTAAVESSADYGPAIEYTAADEGGTDSFVYEVCDRLGACATAEVTVMVGTTGCTIVGTDGSDTLNGTPGDDVICGLGGDDTIYGLGGDDTIVGGNGNDSLYGGDATLIGATDGDDLLWGGSGDDTLYGGNGTDTVYGGAGDDTLYGNRRDDRIYGGTGNDTAVGGGENDTIFGGDGDDTLDGHAGDDAVHGGAGIDTLYGGNGDDTLWGGPGDDTLTGGAGADSLHGGSGDDDLDGNTQNDSLWGGPGDDTLDGQGHDDQLHGGSGEDALRGGAADDRVYGGSGDDSLDGGSGTDHLNGGPDTDTCRRGQATAGCETESRRP